jgi:hypothetical protein
LLGLLEISPTTAELVLAMNGFGAMELAPPKWSYLQVVAPADRQLTR